MLQIKHILLLNYTYHNYAFSVLYFIILEHEFMSSKGTLALLSFHAFKEVDYVFMLYIGLTLLNRFF